jgi:hypothetical protein
MRLLLAHWNKQLQTVVLSNKFTGSICAITGLNHTFREILLEQAGKAYGGKNGVPHFFKNKKRLAIFRSSL